MIAAEGGTAENHSEVVLRSRAVTGPYEPGPSNPILTQRDLPIGRPSPITSAGHASFVETQDGQWWSVFLATRPYADDYYNTGRETFMLPVSWRDGWPQILRQGLPIPVVHPAPDLTQEPALAVPTSGSFRVIDSFNGHVLPPYWMMLRTPEGAWYSLHNGSLELQPRAVSIGSRGNPSFLARRQQHANASANTVVRYSPENDGARAGLVAFQNDAYWYFAGLVRHGSNLAIELDYRAGPQQPESGKNIASVPFGAKPGAPLYLKAVARGGTYDFYYGYAPGKWRPLKLGTDGRLLSTKRAGGFVGAVFGVYAYDPQSKVP